MHSPEPASCVSSLGSSHLTYVLLPPFFHDHVSSLIWLSNFLFFSPTASNCTSLVFFFFFVSHENVFIFHLGSLEIEKGNW